ncbi:hypothetical protein D3C75_852310 [compost metagenome]
MITKQGADTLNNLPKRRRFYCHDHDILLAEFGRRLGGHRMNVKQAFRRFHPQPVAANGTQMLTTGDHGNLCAALGQSGREVATNSSCSIDTNFHTYRLLKNVVYLGLNSHTEIQGVELPRSSGDQ